MKLRFPTPSNAMAGSASDWRICGLISIRFLASASCIAVALSAGGCAEQQGRSSGPKTTPTPAIDAQRVQGNTMSFADGYSAGMADAFDRVAASSKSAQVQLAAIQGKGMAAAGALGNAVNPNPVAGLMDMAMMVTLTRESIEAPWSRELFGPQNVEILLAAIEPREAEIWRTAAQYLTPTQIDELKKLAERWRREHSEQRFIASGRLADFAEAKQPASGSPSLVGSVFSVIRLDPFTGLDPAVRQVEESRLLGERLFFYLQHMPSLLSWQIDATYLRMIEAPQIAQVIKDTTTIAGSTTRFSDATSRFSDASSELAGTVENFRRELPQRQAVLVDQLNDLVARQRDGALKQATTQVSALRDTTVQQLDSTVGVQQQMMARNLQGVMDQSIGQLYTRVRALILIAAGSLLAVLLIYRLIASGLLNRRSRR
jgi:hypothetical protein